MNVGPYGITKENIERRKDKLKTNTGVIIGGQGEPQNGGGNGDG